MDLAENITKKINFFELVIQKCYQYSNRLHLKSQCLNAFYQMVTMFGISVDEYFYPDMGADEAAKKRINIQLNSLNESELRLVEGIINAIIENRETEGA